MKLSRSKTLALMFVMILLVIASFMLLEYFNNSNDKRPIVHLSAAQSLSSLEDLDSPQDGNKRTQSTEKESINENAYIVQCNIDKSRFPYKVNEDQTFDEAEQYRLWGNSDTFSDRFTSLMTRAITPMFGDNSSALSKPQLIEGLKELLNDTTASHPAYTNLMHYTLAGQCSQESRTDSCPNRVFDNAIDAMPNNGALWSIVANHAAITNNEAMIVLALEQVIVAPLYEEYWSTSAALFDDSFSRLDNSTRAISLLSAQSSANLIIAAPPNIQLFEYCKTQSEHRADVAQLCLDSGLKLLSAGRNKMTRLLGASLSMQIYELNNELESIKKLRETKNIIRNHSKSVQAAQELLFFDEQLLEHWFQDLKEHGELEAEKRLTEEAMRLSLDPNYAPCPVGKTQRKD